MKQVLQNPSATVVRDVPLPPCLPGNVLVRNHFSAISSGTERSVASASQRSLIGRVRDRPELALRALERLGRDGLRQTRAAVRSAMAEEYATGYSSAGVVLEVGARVRGITPGDRVACGGAGFANHAEVVSVPCNLCARVPDGVSLESASLTTIAAVALHGIRLADVRVGDCTAIIGCGLLGQIASRLLAASGAMVIALDIDERRVEQALTAGADHAFLARDNPVDRVLKSSAGVGVDQVIITAAATTNDPLVLATQIARDRGTVVLVGVAAIDVPRAAFFDKELHFRVSRSYGPGRYDQEYEERGLDYPIGYVRWTEQRNMQCILDLQARGKLSLEDLIDDVLPVSRAEEAYSRLTGPAIARPHGALALSYPDAKPAEERRSLRKRPTEQTFADHEDGNPRIGVIGPGNFAIAVLVPAFASAGAQLVAVSGGSGVSAEAAVRRSGFRYAAESEEALLADDDLDAVVLATRHGTHARIARDALLAGKHVFCEKPLALDQRELQEVLETASNSGRILTVGFNRRFSPHVRELREFVTAASGPLTAAYRVSAGSIAPESWIQDLEQGGGRIIGEACHFFDTLSFITGAPITEVHAFGLATSRLPLQARDNVVVALTFGDGSIGNLTYVADGAAGVRKERLEVFLDDRTAVLDDFRSLELFAGSKPILSRLRVQDKGYSEEARAFLRGIREGVHPIALDELANVHRACLATVRSLQTGTPVTVANWV